MLQDINISDINRDGTQTRAALDEETVVEYAERMKAGDEFPPLIVFVGDGGYWLADGFHRIEGKQRAGFTTVTCEVRNGTKRDAILFGMTANITHGLRRTNADKRRAVEILLADAEWSKRSDRWLAEKAGVSNRFVSNLRGETVNRSQLDSPPTRIGRDGKERQLPTPTPPVDDYEDESEEWDGDAEEYEEIAQPSAEAKPRPFDENAAGNRLCDWLRNELNRWPNKYRHEAAHWIRQILEKEFNL